MQTMGFAQPAVAGYRGLYAMNATPDNPPSSDGPSLAPLPVLSGSLVLVANARVGDIEVLNRLLQGYYPRVHRIVRVHMGARLLAVLEDIDIAQETLAVAMRKIADFEPRSHARIIDWLAQIAENQMRDAHRKYLSSEKRNPERAVPLDAHAESGAHSRAGLQISNGEPGPATVAARKELAEVLDECLELLPSRYRELILLREYAHADRDEIAAQARRPNAHAAEVAY